MPGSEKKDTRETVEVISENVIHKRERQKVGAKIKVNPDIAKWLKKEKHVK